MHLFSFPEDVFWVFGLSVCLEYLYGIFSKYFSEDKLSFCTLVLFFFSEFLRVIAKKNGFQVP